MTRHKLAVFAPAPIPVGQEIEVHLMNAGGDREVAVRDLTTGILYGSGKLFGEAAKEDAIDGYRRGLRSSAPGRFARGESTYRARVVECVIANVPGHEGWAPCTSFVVEVAATPHGPYRT